MPDIALKFENISKYYKLYNSPKDRLKEALHPFRKKLHKEFYALKHIDLEVKKGEIIGIVGKNGAGKSTLLKLIARIIRPSAGIMTVNGNVSALMELECGLNPEFTGVQNIYFYGIIKGYSREVMDQKLDDIVEFAGIGDFVHQPLKTYSSGMKARLGFALAINMEPEILILDEILAVGDELFRRKCYAKMEEFFKSGCTVFFVSHSIASVNEICTKAILLDNGEVILEGSPKLVTANYQRYLFSKPRDAAKIREELLQLNNNDRLKTKFEADFEMSGKQNNNKEKKENKTEPPVPGKKPFFTAGLTPQSTIKYNHPEAEISSVHIKTPEGKKVNALVMDQTYIYTYNVKFKSSLEKVTVGMEIKNEKGICISGCASGRIKKYIAKVSRDDEYQVEWEFLCQLLPGNYYTNAGVAFIADNERKIAARIIDAYVFKVQETAQLLYTGLTHLNQDLKITKTN